METIEIIQMQPRDGISLEIKKFMTSQAKAIPISAIGDRMMKRKETVAVAESVTAGQLQLFFSTIPHSQEFFQGGITVYNLGQKSRQLNIDPIHAQSCNSVSEKIATDMASNVARKFLSDWGIGVTGYSSPVPELDIKLFVCLLRNRVHGVAC